MYQDWLIYNDLTMMSPQIMIGKGNPFIDMFDYWRVSISAMGHNMGCFPI